MARRYALFCTEIAFAATDSAYWDKSAFGTSSRIAACQTGPNREIISCTFLSIKNKLSPFALVENASSTHREPPMPNFSNFGLLRDISELGGAIFITLALMPLFSSRWRRRAKEPRAGLVPRIRLLRLPAPDPFLDSKASHDSRCFIPFR